jgi:hypothetical protein
MRAVERLPLMLCTPRRYRPLVNPAVHVRFLRAADEDADLAAHQTIRSTVFADGAWRPTAEALAAFRHELSSGGDLRRPPPRRPGRRFARLCPWRRLRILHIATPARRGVAPPHRFITGDGFARGCAVAWLTAETPPPGALPTGVPQAGDGILIRRRRATRRRSASPTPGAACADGPTARQHTDMMHNPRCQASVSTAPSYRVRPPPRSEHRFCWRPASSARPRETYDDWRIAIILAAGAHARRLRQPNGVSRGPRLLPCAQRRTDRVPCRPQPRGSRAGPAGHGRPVRPRHPGGRRGRKQPSGKPARGGRARSARRSRLLHPGATPGLVRVSVFETAGLNGSPPTRLHRRRLFQDSKKLYATNRRAASATRHSCARAASAARATSRSISP